MVGGNSLDFGVVSYFPFKTLDYTKHAHTFICITYEIQKFSAAFFNELDLVYKIIGTFFANIYKTNKRQAQ